VMNTRKPSSRLITRPRIPATGIALPSKGLYGGRAKGNSDFRPYQGEFVIRPPAAGPYFARIGLGVDAALAPGLELEMLYCIGDIGPVPGNARLVQQCVEQFPRRPDEGPAGKILLGARLFAKEKDLGAFRTFSEYCLGGVAPERAAPACCRSIPRLGKRGVVTPVLRLRCSPSGVRPGPRPGGARVSLHVSGNHHAHGLGRSCFRIRNGQARRRVPVGREKTSQTSCR
jgi:hypothetical protein